MRNNLPVTNTPFDFSGADPLLSTTDTRGKITYANAAFVHISGFDLEELQEQPHNIVRHPDMPSEAFADMWRSLKSGQSWTALVKNRRKNGDHYWVRANAAPMVRNGKLTGYISVRTKPDSREVSAASAFYKRFKEGNAGGYAFHCGLIVHTGLRRVLSTTQLLPTAWRVRLPLLLADLACIGALALTPLTGLPLAGAMLGVSTALLLACAVVEVQITNPLRRVLLSAQQVASGSQAQDLHFNRCDDVGLIARAIVQSGLNLQAFMADVQAQVSDVQTASQEIARANLDLSQRTEQAAASLEQTSSAMEQQTATVSQNSDSAQQASQLAQATTEVASKGGAAVSNVVSTMTLITEASHKIAEITNVINGISFQTSILALNAAVEAARAGEQGRGFAVVATEVRSLAGRSAAAAREIKLLIDDSASKVLSGSRQVAIAGQTMDDIVHQVSQVSHVMAEITAASKEQATGIGQVAQAVTQLDSMTQQNAAMVEQSSAAAKRMNDQATHLMRAINVFATTP